jgi:hypothetical protein
MTVVEMRNRSGGDEMSIWEGNRRESIRYRGRKTAKDVDGSVREKRLRIRE